MPSADETVEREAILELLKRVRAMGWMPLFEELIEEEPMLAGYAMSASHNLVEQLGKLGVPQPILAKVDTAMMSALLVGIQSMRQASRDLWRDFLPGEGLDPDRKTSDS